MDWHPILYGRMPKEGVDVFLRSKKEQYYIGMYHPNAGIFRVISQYKLQEDGTILALTTGFHETYFTHWTEITLPAAVTTVTANPMPDIPRRIRLDLMTPEELGIHDMVGEVEKLGAHPLLTDVVVLLGEARNKLADWVDQKATQPAEPILGICNFDYCRQLRGKL